MISQSAEYALYAVIHLGAGTGRPLTTGEIAAATGTPTTYLAKVLRALKRDGMVAAQRGLGGGFVLSRSLDELTVLEVINAVDPIRRHEQCPFGLEAHRHRLCALHRRLNEGIGLMERLFEATPIRELREDSDPPAAQVAPLERAGLPDPPGMGALADHIEATHHVYLRRELPRLEAMLARLLDAHQARHPDLREPAAVFAGLKDELESHMVKEEKVLIPIVRELEAAATLPEFPRGSVANPMRVMELEHDRAGAALGRIRTLTDGYVAPADGCATYRTLVAGLAELKADLHRHIHKENNVLFPKARAVEAMLTAR